MRRIRFSIAGLMFAVAMSAVLVAALRSGSAAWAGAMLMLCWGILGLAIVGAICRRGGERVWWLGFALFGCGYMMLAFWSENSGLPTTTLLLYLGSGFDPNIPQPGTSSTSKIQWSHIQIAHCVWALLAAFLGGGLARLLFGTRVRESEQPITLLEPYGPGTSIWRRRPVVIWLTGLALVALAAVAGSLAAPGLWAGVIFLLTCGMLGVSALGALVGRGKWRTMWLGAALFGCGYMFFTFGRSAEAGWPYPPTTHLLNALRPGAPLHWSGFPDASYRNNSLNETILRALEQPVPMHFPDGVALEDLLTYIRRESETRVGKPIPIYVDPVGLFSVRKTMTSTVRIDYEGAALKNSLRLCMNQLDLSFAVRDGFLMITEAGTALPVYEDPFLIVGHCFLALIAAAVGGVLAPLVSDARGRASVDTGT